MNPQELLQGRINRAKAAMEKSQTAVEKAKEALEKWKQENPGFSLTNEWFLYYQKEVDKCYNALDKCQNALERKEEIYKELISNKVGIGAEKKLDYESFMQYEFPNFMSYYTINYEAAFGKTCLEMDLDHRFTN